MRTHDLDHERSTHRKTITFDSITPAVRLQTNENANYPALGQVPGLRARCDLGTGTRRSRGLTVALWSVQLAVWALATLALAGYTNFMRKTG